MPSNTPRNVRRRKRRRLDKQFPEGHCDFCEAAKHFTAIHCLPAGKHAAHRACHSCYDHVVERDGEGLGSHARFCPLKWTNADRVVLALRRMSS